MSSLKAVVICVVGNRYVSLHHTHTHKNVEEKE
jgi:hypothetical protein